MDQPSAAGDLSSSQRIVLLRQSLALLPGVDCQRVRAWVPRDGRLVLVEDERDTERHLGASGAPMPAEGRVIRAGAPGAGKGSLSSRLIERMAEASGSCGWLIRLSTNECSAEPSDET